MSKATTDAVLADLEQRLEVEGQPIQGYDGPLFRGMEVGYRDAARMAREARRLLA